VPMTVTAAQKTATGITTMGPRLVEPGLPRSISHG
jgi:hypothetical protein